jgi:hypothetical protein
MKMKIVIGLTNYQMIKNILTYVSRLYSYHFDVYLNNIYRNKKFPRSQIQRHIDELITDETIHDMWIGIPGEVRISCILIQDLIINFVKVVENPFNESPFAEFINKKTIKFKLIMYL